MVYKSEDYELSIEGLLDDIRRSGIKAAIQNVSDPYGVALLTALSAVAIDGLSELDYQNLEDQVIYRLIDLYPEQDIRIIYIRQKNGHIRETFLDNSYDVTTMAGIIYRYFKEEGYEDPEDFWKNALEVDYLTANELDRLYAAFIYRYRAEQYE